MGFGLPAANPVAGSATQFGALLDVPTIQIGGAAVTVVPPSTPIGDNAPSTEHLLCVRMQLHAERMARAGSVVLIFKVLMNQLGGVGVVRTSL
jgi:hypothetical protein